MEGIREGMREDVRGIGKDERGCGGGRERGIGNGE